MALVTAKQIAKAVNLNKLGFIGTFIGWILLKVLRISTLNKIYEQKRDLKGITFLNSVLNEFEVKYELPKEDLKRIPKEGAFITVSNHPLGGIDGIILLKLLSEQRDDVKTISNFLLDHIKPMRPYLISVNPFENRKDIGSSITGIKAALQHLKEGKPLGIFPAGEVSTHRKEGEIVDRPWNESAIKIIQKANVPVVPIYFHAKNSSFFYFLSGISSLLRTAKLPSELLSQKDKTIKIRIGKPIKVADQKNYKEPIQFGEFLRKKTYMLANPFRQEKSVINRSSLGIGKRPKRIATPKNQEKINNEINNLKDNHLLFSSKNYDIFFSPAKLINNTLHEIGRLREITFRAVGEGTNKSIDLDSYDHYYHHLFLWDKSANKMVGAYRMGLGKDILKKYGIKGFYVHSLFRFEPELHTILESSIEMGRAFIIKEYQQKPMPLFLLWKGIVHVTLRYPEYKYLLGGVSISNQFSGFSKSLMIEFMKSHYYDPYIAQFIRPKKEYKVKLKDTDKDFIFDETQADLNKFDKFIDEIEPGTLRIPVLIKKYLKQNAKLVAFNVDPKFNNAIDGLMYIRISDIPESTVKPVLEEYQEILEKKAEAEKEQNNLGKNRAII